MLEAIREAAPTRAVAGRAGIADSSTEEVEAT